MPQEDRIYSTGREAIESLREDYRDFNDDPAVSFEEFAGDVLDIFNAAPDAVYSYDPQIRPGSIQRLPEPNREKLLGLCSLASTQLMNRARNCANPHDMVRYALAAEWIENDNAELIPFLTQEERNRITIELAKNNRTGASGVLEDSALENVTDAFGMLLADTPYEHVIDTRSPMGKPSAERPEVFCTIQWARDDIAAAIEDACDPSYDVELDRHGPQGEQVEALIDQVIDGIGSDLQDRSIAMGWSVIANFLPDEVIRQAAALGVPEEERNAHAEPASGHGPSMPRLADEAEASRTASDMLAGATGTDHRSPQQEK